MGRVKTKKSLKPSDYEEVLRLAKSLLKNLKDKEEWTKADEEKLKKLTKIIVILLKLEPLQPAAKVEVFNTKKDQEIIKRFLARKR